MTDGNAPLPSSYPNSVEQTALEAAREIESMGGTIHSAQKTARIQIIVRDAIRRHAQKPTASGDEKERHHLAVKIDTWSPQSKPLTLIARERRLIVDALRYRTPSTAKTGDAQASTYTEICMNEKCPRGCGVPVEVVRTLVAQSTDGDSK